MIKTQKQLVKNLGGMTGVVTYDAWLPYLTDAIELHIKPAIGDEFYDYLNALVLSTDSPDIATNATTNEKKLMQYLRIALVNYADLYSSNRLGQSNSDAGKADPSSNHTTASPKWKAMASLELIRDKADTYLEKALELLADSPDSFSAYTTSAFFTKYAGMLVYSANRLTEFLPACNNSHTFYNHLKNSLRLEQQKVKGMIGATFYNKVVEENTKLLKGETVTDEYQEVLDYLCRYITSKALVSSLPWLNISEDFRLKTRVGGLEDKTILNDNRRTELKLIHSQAADTTKASLLDYLNNTASVTLFPEYFNSPNYVAITPTSTFSRLDNNPDNKYAFI
jgi:hypothetical protein